MGGAVLVQRLFGAAHLPVVQAVEDVAQGLPLLGPEVAEGLGAQCVVRNQPDHRVRVQEFPEAWKINVKKRFLIYFIN